MTRGPRASWGPLLRPSGDRTPPWGHLDCRCLTSRTEGGTLCSELPVCGALFWSPWDMGLQPGFDA